MIYKVFLWPILIYGILVWSSASKTQVKRVNLLQNISTYVQVCGSLRVMPVFFAKWRKSRIEKKALKEAYGENLMPKPSFYEWFKKFEEELEEWNDS